MEKTSEEQKDEILKLVECGGKSLRHMVKTWFFLQILNENREIDDIDTLQILEIYENHE